MTNLPSANRRYLALWFPYLPADRLRSRTHCGFAPETPLAFTEKVKGALRLAAVDQAARSLGLEPGMTLADARARVPVLEAADLDRPADRSWLLQLADGAMRYTPRVAEDPPDGLLLDISGCAHLFGGEQGLAVDLEARMARLKLSFRMAFAATPRAARALARYQALPARDEAEAVRRLPVAALELDPEMTQGLVRAGLKTIGALARRPTPALAARFGPAAVSALHELLGSECGPIAPRVPDVPIQVERRFAEPVGHTAYALRMVGELVAEAGRMMEARRLGGRRFETAFFRSDGLVLPLSVETGRPTRDSALVMRLMEERIESLSDPIDPGFGFDLIRLSVPRTEPLATCQLRLDEDGGGAAEVGALVDRLSTRLGRDRVRRVVARDTHVPEQLQLELPAVETTPPTAGWPRSAPGEPPLRPLHLFDPPQPIEVVAEVPDGPPHRFRWRRKLHEIRSFEGPERIASEWWKRRDGAIDRPGRTRDYYRVEDVRGRRFWLFRHGLYSERPDPRWYLHGLFA